MISEIAHSLLQTLLLDTVTVTGFLLGSDVLTGKQTHHFICAEEKPELAGA